MIVNKKYFLNRDFVFSSIIGLIFVSFGLITNYCSGIYATEKQSNPVTDIILSNTPIFNLVGVFVYGILILIAFVGFLIIIKPQRIPFVLKSFGLFLVIRSMFVSMTHIGLYPNTINTTVDILKNITSGGDLFFSGHTGFPFLMALIFWENKKLRYLFLFFSVFFGTVALMGHYHYTIDVMSAFFITYGIYNICLKLFKKDYQIFQNGI
jgi:hypothetical protein